jgi:hypothetical protein
MALRYFIRSDRGVLIDWLGFEYLLVKIPATVRKYQAAVRTLN